MHANSVGKAHMLLKKKKCQPIMTNHVMELAIGQPYVDQLVINGIKKKTAHVLTFRTITRCDGTWVGAPYSQQALLLPSHYKYQADALL